MSFSEWKKYKVGEFCETISKTHKFQNGKVVFLNTGDIEKGKFLHKTYSSPEGLPGQAKKSIQKGDILLSEIRPANGRYAFVDFDAEDYVVSTKLMVIRAKENISPRYLYHFLTNSETTRTLQHLAESRSGTFPQITFTQVQDLEILVPELKTQKQIASFIDSIDDTININQQINKTLEEMAKAIFKEWFVDFNFPNATGKFQETEIGKIPVGWKVATFEDVFDADRGLSYKGAGLAESDATPMHNLNSVLEGGGYKTIGIKYYNGEYKDKHIVNAGEVIVANTEQGHKYMLIGYPAIVPQFYGEHGIFSHHIYRLRPKPNCYLSPDFIYHLLLQTQVRDQVVGFANGTTVNMLKIEGLKKPKFAMPPKELAEKFGEIAKANRLQAEQNIGENQSLMNLRDTLLPKLMKGEVEINSKVLANER